ncbi:microfibrillar-associated protein 1, partial [Tremellales sp. Uapishka_1]
METYRDDLNWDFKAVKPLKITIVGAGIAGLAAAVGLQKAGHDVVILEQVKEIAEVGAGIQMAPNAARIMGRFGLLEKIMQKANSLTKNSLRRWKDNSELGTAPLMPAVGEKYHAPLSVIHRGDLQTILLQGVKDAGVPLHLNTKVVEVDPKFAARVKTADGTWYESDVVICADGIKSHIRSQMADFHDAKDSSSPTGDAAYRILIPKDKLEHDPEAMKLLNEDVGMRWMGPGGHIMAYPIKNNTVYNMVLLHPQKPNASNEESWTNQGDKQEMMDFYKDWNSTVTNLLSYVPAGDVKEWTLNSHRPLPSWIENKCALIGDSCHPMLPYVAQGAAQAIEDAAVLTCTLSLTDNVDLALQVYELIRKERGEKIQNSAAVTRKALHLPDGEEQRKRDEAIAGGGKEGAHNPDLWADHDWQDFMWGVDVMKEAVEEWKTLVAKVEGHHVKHLNAVTY